MYPVSYEADNPGEGRNRLTTFFRSIVVIPWAIVAAIYGFAASIAVVIAWFALVFTGRYPEGLYSFIAGYVRMIGRVNGFHFLATDEWPPFNGEDETGYPVRIGIPEPLPEYSRVKAGFRLIIGIPVILLSYVQALITLVMAIIGWFQILFTGAMSDGVFNPLRSALAYQTRAAAYFGLLTEDYPPFSLEGSSGTDAAAPPPPPPPPPDPSAGRPIT